MEVHTFFIILLAILLAARILGELAAWLRAPQIVGELLAGVLLGPSLLGWVEPAPVIRLLEEIGIILLLFEVGPETDLQRLARAGLKPLIVALPVSHCRSRAASASRMDCSISICSSRCSSVAL